MPKIEFVSYDGEYPNLCSGVLTILVDGVKRELPEHCLVSGGCVFFDDDWNDYVVEGDWCLSDWNFPEDLEPYREEILKIVNENVPKGCCGGCV
jgi:hypothetical protein